VVEKEGRGDLVLKRGNLVLKKEDLVQKRGG